MLRLTPVLAAVWILAVAPAALWAQDQESQPLSALLPRLYAEVSTTEQIVFNLLLPLDEFPELQSQLQDAFRQRIALTRNIIDLASNQLSSFPRGSGSGGFTWTFDAPSAAFTRTSNSFGPIFAERPLTIGRGKLNVGANYQRVTFDHLEDRSLRGGEIVGHLGLKIGDFGIFFADSLDLTVTTDTLNAFAVYGLTDRLDVGVAIPVNRVDMNATLTTRFGTTETGIDEEVLLVTPRSGNATGIGDMVIRAKYTILKHENVGIAESVEVRLPTGDELELLGVAGHQIKLTFIAASELGTLSPHVNLAYTISGTSEAADDPNTFVIGPPEEISYAAGADLALTLRTTVAFDAVGRVLRKVGAVEWGPSPQFGDEFPQFTFRSGEDLHLLLGAVGVRVNPFGNMLLTANVLFPLTKRGLTDKLTWMAGVDYSF
jgi:hypothetical protein